MIPFSSRVIHFMSCSVEREVTKPTSFSMVNQGYKSTNGLVPFFSMGTWNPLWSEITFGNNHGKGTVEHKILLK